MLCCYGNAYPRTGTCSRVTALIAEDEVEVKLTGGEQKEEEEEDDDVGDEDEDMNEEGEEIV